MEVTAEQKKEEKRLYDIAYRAKNKDSIIAKKKKYYQTEAGKKTSKRNRDKLKEYHLKYCATPKYREWKKEYDKKYRAKKEYGEYFESFLLVEEISTHIDNRAVKQELTLTNKKQIKRRNYERTKRSKLESSPLGNA
jgi:hypothetical protein